MKEDLQRQIDEKQKKKDDEKMKNMRMDVILEEKFKQELATNSENMYQPSGI